MVLQQIKEIVTRNSVISTQLLVQPGCFHALGIKDHV
jgi:hypothetical protein